VLGESLAAQELTFDSLLLAELGVRAMLWSVVFRSALAVGHDQRRTWDS
jgi:hypothetical protein